ncbi:pyridoxal phosphate synthase yaaE subunit [Clostridium cavendishii DSM 21758]|uniref:Pyridoxal 5'-phosphate synthase subunit PdxT n=1 Tax=Clostridium cavendishii DSM 21758 TaxID=1121302 RepID=A0A1M6BEM4_9CLOT|nr:pyridoxal 5'-phosphate synthase glutaminase subunit PdxT [Clostridium cavendishii]SHI47155.1 pyridoxal phosphate synthase yaaE subunit [Clostridium cavendishii DSM 21758]
MVIGVLALQGGVEEHINQIKTLGYEGVGVKTEKDLNNLDGLILPGGESTAIRKLLDYRNMFDRIKELIISGLPVWGTCAGMILLAKELEGDTTSHFGVMDIKVLRNAYGRQLGSFEAIEVIEQIDKYQPIPMVFIRAPIIKDILSDDVEILCKVDNKIVVAKQRNMLVSSFHPELTDDLRFLKYFIEKMCIIKYS